MRAAANTVLVSAAVCGSALGLASAGLLAEDLGVGKAIALLAPGALVAAAIVIRWFPETAGRELEETSAEAAPLARVL